MKKNLAFKNALIATIVVTAILLSGCVGQKIVKNGDNVSIDYIGSTEDGKVFDTSIESVAKANDIYEQGRAYQPLNLTIGKGESIKGFDEGIIGMKVGENKTFTIPPDKGYGPVNPKLITTIPIIQDIPRITNLSRTVEAPLQQFESSFGQNHTIGDIINIPNSNIYLTIKNIGNNVTLEYNVTMGQKVIQKGAPWNATVVAIDDKNISLKADVVNNSIINLRNAPWNTTVIGLNNTDVLVRHNPISDIEIPGMIGSARIHFNETYITIDQNNKLAGKTLIFQVTLKVIY